ncbi:hypothetical protein TNCV_793381 [Trichonephila clavipes]|nr:hypothetical protein TNCV_793381 [Trichonephila clavipes]
MTKYTPVKLAFITVEPDGCETDKAPVVFLHGITASKEYWNEIPQNIANATKRKVSNKKGGRNVFILLTEIL